MQTKRQQQVGQTIKRNFSIVLQQEGTYIYGTEALVTVTSVKMSPDMGLAKIYVSVYNVLDKQSVVTMIGQQQNHHRLKSALYQRIRKQIRRMPNFDVYLDDTLDEMYRLQNLFGKLKEDNQMGKDPEGREEAAGEE